jgi:crotonobetainyl-CoA:carnitine CoA-transferase CaiB-like acyl-CoA transferase
MSRLNNFLRGVRVVDLSRYLPGPLATLLLGDLGAEVIKVEPSAGDPISTLGPRLTDGRAAWHAAINAGKSLCVLDLKQAADREQLLGLLDEADVLVESFRPGVIAQLGLGFDTLRLRCPRLVGVSLSGYGQSGPLRDAAGHDNNYLAQAGFLAGVGPAPEVPTLIQPPIADCLGSMFALSTVLGALLARERDGQGCHIDIALADVAMPLQAFGLAGVGVEFVPPVRAQGLLDGGWACYGIYRTADGREMALGAVESKFWAAFCLAADRSDWVERQSDPLPQQALSAEVAAFFASHSSAALTQRFARVDCCLSLVLTMAESVHSPYARSRGLVRQAIGGPGHEALYPAVVNGEPPVGRQPFCAEGRGARRAG